MEKKKHSAECVTGMSGITLFEPLEGFYCEAAKQEVLQ